MKTRPYRLYRWVGLIVLVFVFAGLLGVVSASSAPAGKKPPKPPQYPVQSDLLTPVQKDGNPVPLLTNGGWPLTLRFSMDLSIPGRGIIFNSFEYFPKRGDVGWAVLSDPDNCPSFYPGTSGCLVPGDETVIEFKNDLFVEPLDAYGNPDISQTGASPLLPSLVLLADRGKGIRVGDGPLFPDLGRNNLAAHVNSVSYSLADDCPSSGPCRTSIVAHMLVPTGLLLPEVYIDQAYDLLECPTISGMQQRSAYVEVGHAIKVLQDVTLASWESLGISPFVNITAVLVNGQAPDVVTDSNGDGVVNEKDLIHDDYVLLSEPLTFTVEMTFQERDFISFYFYPLDGNVNGPYYGCSFVIPAGSVSRTPPPR